MAVQNNTYDAAVWYAKNYGFSVFPTYGIKELKPADQTLYACTCATNCWKTSSQGKHPANSKGRNAASKEEAVIQNLWAGRDNLNVAAATGPESGMFVIDVDGLVGEESLRDLEKVHGRLPKTLTAITGRGKHYYFKYPDRKVISRNGIIGEKVDVKGHGGYILIPPSRHISGVYYSFEDDSVPIAFIPDSWKDVLCSEKKTKVEQDPAITFSHHREWSEEEVNSMLSYLDDVVNGGYDPWKDVGMALHSGGYSVKIFDDWSSKGVNYPGRRTIEEKWSSFSSSGGITMGTLVDMAKIRGWKPADYLVPFEMVNLETHPAGAYLKELWHIEDKKESPPKEEKKEFKKSFKDFPFDPRHLDEADVGIIAETVQWICDTSVYEQPVLAFMNIVAALGSVFGRHYVTPSNATPNLYICSIANTSMGKEHSREKVSILMSEAGYGPFLGADNIKSASGLLTTLTKKPSCLMMLDEFGQFISSITGEKTASHRLEIASLFLTLYGQTRRWFEAGDYADKKMEAQRINCPNLCLYGTTTLASYLPALKKVAVHDGQLNRFIIVAGDEYPKVNRKKTAREIPEDILEGWKKLLPPVGIENLNLNVNDPKWIIVPWDDEVTSYMDSLIDIQLKRVHDGQKAGYGALWGRYRENVMKLALIFSVCRNPATPYTTMAQVAIADKIVTYAIEYMIDLATNHMYENENEKNKKAVLKIIRDCGKRGINRKDLSRETSGIKPRDLNEIIGSLLTSEYIEAESDKGGTSGKVSYRAT